jgi:hypothetical protein
MPAEQSLHTVNRFTLSPPRNSAIGQTPSIKKSRQQLSSAPPPLSGPKTLSPPLPNYLPSFGARPSPTVSEQARLPEILISSPTPDAHDRTILQHSLMSSPPARGSFPPQHTDPYHEARKAIAGSDAILGGGNVFDTLRRQGLIVNSDESEASVNNLRREIEKESQDHAWSKARHKTKR